MNTLNQTNTQAVTTTEAPLILKGDVLSEMDVDSLLALDVFSIDEIIDFVPMPSGSYKFNVAGCKMVEVGDDKSPAIQTEFNLTECTELGRPENAEDAEIIASHFVEGATVKHTETYFFKSTKKTAYGIRSFATIFKKVVPAGQTAQVHELMELAIGTSGECLIEKSSYIPEGKTEEDRRYSSRIRPTGVFFD